eukprot:TRINITY_DN2226_c2_g1_i1.p1 TRINITY_DN2226_c2_g1~~TRINITY_DN2226_c2_g1_i1.p1  ORF type:complete len:690 (+),score=262.57 TRINITY_DN2226_c2_g1_i1:54-2123(+)
MAAPSVVPYAPVAPSARLGESELFYENHSIEDIHKRWADQMGNGGREQAAIHDEMVKELVKKAPKTESEYLKCLMPLRKKYKQCPKKFHLLYAYKRLKAAGVVPADDNLSQVLVSKSAKSQSGVLVITVLTSPTPAVPGGKPQNFSCKWDCHYCPDQPGQPRSYLRDEPAVRRANQNQFDPVLQFVDRAFVLHMNGHPCDKVELLVLGGTWHSYPLEYQEAFVRDLYYAANTFMRPQRARKSLAEEQKENESASCKLIGLTLETRPDCINAAELRRLRKYGCTRVQLGMQHTDDGVLRHVNRGHDIGAGAEALRLLKDSCFKVDIHLMPNLPGSNVALDEAMFDKVLYDEDLQADQWKIYPCEVVPFTRIEKWFREKSYVPYAEEALIDLICKVKAKVHPWIRLNRIVRDIPSQYIAGSSTTNLREEILQRMGRAGTRCRCIRCREIGDIGGWQVGAEKHGGGRRAGNRDGNIAERTKKLSRQATLKVRHYKGNRGDEYFISYEAPGEILCGFCRLRCSPREYFPEGLFPELGNAALVRELHVYGQLIATGDKEKEKDSDSQHVGFGTMMMAEAEHIARQHGHASVAVIAGIGTRNYYRKLGYEVEGEGGFSIKHFRDGTQLRRPPRGRLAMLRGLQGDFAVYSLRWRVFAVLVCLLAVQWVVEWYTGLPFQAACQEAAQRYNITAAPQ